MREDLITFCRKSRLPVVFTDLEPFDKESEYPENAAFVGYDTGERGELAGRGAANRVLYSRVPGVTITIDDQCEFRRSLAQRAVCRHLRQLQPHQRLDAIFCTNDGMALGAVDALAQPAPATRTTVIVGIDGVLEATTLIDTADSPLRATVVQDTDLLAGKVVDALDKLRRRRPVPKRTILRAKIHESDAP